MPRTFLLLCGLALSNGCGTPEKEPEPVVAVQVAPAKRGPIAQTVSAEAVVFPLQQAVITPKITSTIHKFHVQRGAHVKEGQILAELENADLAGAAEQSKGEFEQAEASYATTTGATLPQQIQKAELDAAAARSAFDAQKKVYDARKELFDQGAIPRRDLDAAEVAFVQTRSQNEQAQKQLIDLNRLGKEQALKSASAQLSASEGKYRNAKALLSYSLIRSPIDGVVTDRPLYEGELATANQPILTVMNTSKLIAKAHIVQSEAVQLKIGDPAELNVPGLAEPIKGRVMLISPALDPGSTTIEVWVEAIKPGPVLKPGMNVSIEATAKSEKDALVVPAASLFKTSDGADYVMLAGSDGKAHQAKVKIGIRNKDSAEILSGIKEKDSVITVGGYALPDSTKITIEAAPAPEGDAEKDSADKDTKPGATPAEKPAASAPAKAKE
ncbi:MAG: efflux RND transporter periplasmic adaptor subunit [Candidatus Acidiferrum sp.]